MNRIRFVLVLCFLSAKLIAQIANPFQKAEDKYKDIYSAEVLSIELQKEPFFDPHNYNYFVFKAEQKIENGEFEKAIFDLKKAKELYEKNFQSSEKDFMGKTKDGYPSYLIANCYIELEEYDRALKYLKQSIEDQPFFVDAYNLLGITYLLKADTFRTEWRTVQIRGYDMYRSQELKKKYKELDTKALVSLNKSLQLNPNNPNTLHTLAFAYYISGDKYSAMKYINHNLKINPKHLKSYKLKADMVGYGNTSKKNSIYDQAVYNNVVNPDAYYMRGLHYINIRNFSRAKEDIQKGIWLKGDSILGMYAFSMISFLQKKDIEAIPWVINFYKTNGYMFDSKTYYKSDFEEMAHIEILRECRKIQLNKLDKIAFSNYEKSLFLEKRIIPEYNKMLASGKIKSDSTVFFRKVRALHLYSLNNRKVNLDEINFILEHDSSNAFKYLKGKFLYENELYEEAKSELTELIKRNDNFYFAKYYLALSNKETRKYKEALRLLDECIKFEPENIIYKIDKAHCLHLMGDSKLSLDILKELKNTYTSNPYVLTLIGKIYIENGDYKSGNFYLNRSLKKDSTYVSPLILKARLSVKEHNYIKAKELYDMALRIDPKNLTALNEIGELYFSFERFKEAKKNFYECTQISNANPLYKLNLARVYSKLGEFDKAFNLCRVVEKIDTGSIKCLETYGMIYLDKNVPDSARRYFKLAYQNSRIEFQEYGKLALANFKLGNYSEAEENAENAIEINMNDYKSKFILGLSKLHLGKIDEAKLIFTQALSLPDLDQKEKMNAKALLMELSQFSVYKESVVEILKGF